MEEKTLATGNAETIRTVGRSEVRQRRDFL